ncbi:MAG TPA: succinate--CoA ligase subunit alpha, partial [Pseudonocardiaceae bacterium]|nr:succinate--CoA ligase subunit alpha [Pseudonocardiaceae bacterium]
MAILLTKDSRIIVQGMTGVEGRRHTQRMLRAGSQVVGGVTPGKGGQTADFDGATLPVFDTVAESIAATGA